MALDEILENAWLADAVTVLPVIAFGRPAILLRLSYGDGGDRQVQDVLVAPRQTADLGTASTEVVNAVQVALAYDGLDAA